MKQVGRESLERKNQGVMIGSLVCWDKKEKKRIILYAVSGNNKQLIPVNTNSKDIFVPSIVSSEQIDQALKENDKEIHELTEQINELTLINKASPQRARLLKKRTALTDSSLQKVFYLYLFTKYDGRKLSLNGIIKCHNNHLPPTGTGDCCAPKLLSYAFEKDYEIISMDEVYYGRDTKNKKNGISYAPCDERCGYILPSIMGLEILYRDKDIVVINKPSGLLSVPGKGKDKEDCAEARVRNLFPDAPKQCAVHRLDMETSGILVLALNKEAHRKLNEQFAEGKVHKKYIALLDGILHGKPEGRTELPFRLDIENRPHQIYDPVNGKIGITEWKKSIPKRFLLISRSECDLVHHFLFSFPYSFPFILDVFVASEYQTNRILYAEYQWPIMSSCHSHCPPPSGRSTISLVLHFGPSPVSLPSLIFSSSSGDQL